MPGRRGFLLVGAGAEIAALAAFVSRRFDGEKPGRRTGLPRGHRRNLALIDIRRPDEWALTGVGRGAQPLDMLNPDFDESLARLIGADRNAPIALICARGVRSARLACRLARAGYTRIIDVPEGMPASAAGPGRIARGSPVRPG